MNTPLLAGLALLYVHLARLGAAQDNLGWDTVLELLSEETRDEALTLLERSGQRNLIAGMNDVLYYHYVIGDHEMAERIARVMEAVAGESVEPTHREGWAMWVGRHEDLAPRDGYLFFKRSIFQRYDRAFRGFLNPRFTFRIRPEEIEWGGVTKDGIPALDEPGFVPAAEDDFLRDDDRVFGIYLNGEAKAYPHRILDPHEMCNDVVGGRHVSLSYCTLCGSGVLFDAEHATRAGTEPFSFGSSGLLYRSNKLMYDRQTNSLWNNLTGEPVSGTLATSGVRLERLPIVVSTWREWRERHPDTLVVDVHDTGFDRDYTVSPYEGYFRSEKTMFPVWLQNDALEKKDWVYALIVNGQPKAYAIEVLKKERLTHDELGSTAIVLVTSSAGSVRAYRTGGRRFRRGPTDTALIEEARPDANARADTWRVTEDYLSGPNGDRLPRIPGHQAFWFGWYAFYPTTELYEPN